MVMSQGFITMLSYRHALVTYMIWRRRQSKAVATTACMYSTFFGRTPFSTAGWFPRTFRGIQVGLWAAIRIRNYSAMR